MADVRKTELIAPLRIDFAGGWIDIPEFSSLCPGYVVNAAISPHIRIKKGKVRFSPYLPGGGVSSSTGALVLENLDLMTRFSNDNLVHATPSEFAETIFRLENHMLDFKIGRQDPFSIALGGINCLRFGKNDYKAGDFEVETHIDKRTPQIQDLEGHLLLIHSGIQRPAQGLVEHVRRRIYSKAPESLVALKEIAYCGELATRAVQSGNFEGFEDIMDRNWSAQKKLVPECTSERIDELYQGFLENGAAGGKLCGAGGGGYFVLYCEDKERLKKYAKSQKLQVIEPKFEMRDVLTLNGLRTSPRT